MGELTSLWASLPVGDLTDVTDVHFPTIQKKLYDK